MPQGTMVVQFSESNVFKRQVAHSFERGVYIGGAALNVGQQRTELFFCHPLPTIANEWRPEGFARHPIK
jgi:hypothetical protein